MPILINPGEAIGRIPLKNTWYGFTPSMIADSSISVESVLKKPVRKKILMVANRQCRQELVPGKSSAFSVDSPG